MPPPRKRRGECIAGDSPVDAPALGRVGNAESSYTRFAYSYARSAGEAYAKEWRNYDAFGGGHGLDNETQPASAAATGELTHVETSVPRAVAPLATVGESPGEHRAAKTRARFWAEVREGQREAEARSRP